MFFVVLLLLYYFFFFFKQKTAYEMRISDWSSDVCSSDLHPPDRRGEPGTRPAGRPDRLHRPLLAIAAAACYVPPVLSPLACPHRRSHGSLDSRVRRCHAGDAHRRRLCRRWQFGRAAGRERVGQSVCTSGGGESLTKKNSPDICK